MSPMSPTLPLREVGSVTGGSLGDITRGVVILLAVGWSGTYPGARISVFLHSFAAL